MEIITANVTGRTRRATLHGRRYLVAPLSLITPGVLNGSRGPLFYPPEEVSRDPQIWNFTPLTNGHPTVNGQPVSAKTPDIFEKFGLGYVFNSKYDGKLRAEGWYEEEATRRLAPEIWTALDAGTPLELSTGVYTDNAAAENGANYNGKEYIATARNYRSDHVATLFQSVGACSIRDGCGVLVNEETLTTTANASPTSSLLRKLSSALGVTLTDADTDASPDSLHPDVPQTWNVTKGEGDEEASGKGFKSAAQRKAFFGKLGEGEIKGEEKGKGKESSADHPSQMTRKQITQKTIDKVVAAFEKEHPQEDWSHLRRQMEKEAHGPINVHDIAYEQGIYNPTKGSALAKAIDSAVDDAELHASHVRQALKEGRKVPVSVLADYPEIAEEEGASGGGGPVTPEHIRTMKPQFGDGGRPKTPRDAAVSDWQDADEREQRLAKQIESPSLQLIKDTPAGRNKIADLTREIEKVRKQKTKAEKSITANADDDSDPIENASHFATCDRDNKGHCLAGTGGSDSGKGQDSGSRGGSSASSSGAGDSKPSGMLSRIASILNGTAKASWLAAKVSAKVVATTAKVLTKGLGAAYNRYGDRGSLLTYLVGHTIFSGASVLTGGGVALAGAAAFGLASVEARNAVKKFVGLITGEDDGKPTKNAETGSDDELADFILQFIGEIADAAEVPHPDVDKKKIKSLMAKFEKDEGEEGKGEGKSSKDKPTDNADSQPSDSLDMPSSKACKIVHDGSVNDHPLTDSQRKMFAAKCHENDSDSKTDNEDTTMNRSETISWLTTNCDCWKGKQQLLADNRIFTDDDLAKIQKAVVDGRKQLAALEVVRNKTGVDLVANANPDGAYADLEAKCKAMWEKDKGGMAGNAAATANSSGTKPQTDEEWLAAAPPGIRAGVKMAQEIVQRQRQATINRLVANIADEERRKRKAAVYNAMTPEQLAVLSEDLDAEQVTPAFGLGGFIPNYSGAGALTGNASNVKDDSDNVLPDPTLNFDDYANDRDRDDDQDDEDDRQNRRRGRRRQA